MAKGVDIAALSERIIGDARNGVFAPVYLLMGEEPYYPERVCEALIRHALSDEERDFNQTVFFGLDVDAGAVASEARLYPMMAERRLVVVKEAQNMKSIEELDTYCQDPMDSTVLILLLHGATTDKRRSLYKTVSKTGVVLDSPKLRDYEIDRWITAYYRSRGLQIAPDAAVLLGEYAGVDLERIAVETDKLLKNLPEGTTTVSAAHIERNVGISRQYNVFELTKALSLRDRAKALKIASYIGAAPKFALPMALSALTSHFYRILKYEALIRRQGVPSSEDKAKVLSVNPYFFREYDTAAANYPLPKVMRVMALLEEYDFKGKGGDAGEATPEELLTELVAKILNV